ncbi:MAG: hypothetical protein HQ445_07890, partial [Polaromonas sp.]|nr:hypothetical protein [Polaromonas sp.]
MTRQSTTCWALASLMALVLASSHLLDGPGDIDAAFDTAADAQHASSQALRDLQSSAPASARREAAARQLCAETRGAGASVRWSPEGHLICSLPNRPTPLSQHAKA